MRFSIFYKRTILIGVCTLFSCNEEQPFGVDLTDSFLKNGTAETADIQSRVYQIPPTSGEFFGGDETPVGSMRALYLGKDGDFDVPEILFSIPNLSAILDSSWVIESAYFDFTVDTSKSSDYEYAHILELGIVEMDSNYSESESNFTNIDWLSESNIALVSEAVMITQQLDSTSSVRYSTNYRFHLMPNQFGLIETWADTDSVAVDPLFIIKPETEMNSMLAFYSSESSVNRPSFTIVYKTGEVVENDVITPKPDVYPQLHTIQVGFLSDVSIVYPPSLETIDSSRIYAGSAAGMKSLMIFDFESLNIPPHTLIIKGDLYLTVDSALSYLQDNSDIEFKVYAVDSTLTDSISNLNNNWPEILTEDNYEQYAFGSSANGSIDNNTVKIGIKDLLQNMELDVFDKLYLKLVASNSSSFFEYASFYKDKDEAESLAPKIEILYETP
tara:strand:+ start:1890 stop:3218 length:1329 start_codon:yes stop_codon:yes gene_type:complete